MKRRIQIVLAAALLFAAPSQFRCSMNRERAAANSTAAARVELVVKAAPAERRDWTVTIPISGSLRSLSIFEIKTEVAGRLIATHFQEGDLVGKGQLVAEIDSTNYRLAYDQAMAALGVALAGLDRARVAADHARREKERADNLLRSGGITEKDHQAATTGVKETESQVRMAEAQIGQGKAAVAIAEKALRDCRILAPEAGQVQRKYFDSGTLLAPGASLYTLVDNTRLELECLVPSYRLSEIHTGQRATFSTPTWGERRFQGSVAAINPMIEPDNRSVKVKLRIANRRGELKAGMYARGEIEVRREPGALTIPRTSLIAEKEESSAASVYVIQNGQSRRRNVEVGGFQQDRVWIRQGLTQGELVIVEIGPALKDGMPVRVASAPAPEAK